MTFTVQRQVTHRSRRVIAPTRGRCPLKTCKHNTSSGTETDHLWHRPYAHAQHFRLTRPWRLFLYKFICNTWPTLRFTASWFIIHHVCSVHIRTSSTSSKQRSQGRYDCIYYSTYMTLQQNAGFQPFTYSVFWCRLSTIELLSLFQSWLKSLSQIRFKMHLHAVKSPDQLHSSRVRSSIKPRNLQLWANLLSAAPSPSDHGSDRTGLSSTGLIADETKHFHWLTSQLIWAKGHMTSFSIKTFNNPTLKKWGFFESNKSKFLSNSFRTD